MAVLLDPDERRLSNIDVGRGNRIALVEKLQ
jgi:hypothetical protein